MTAGGSGWIPRRQALEATSRVVLKGESLSPALMELTRALAPREAAWTRALAQTTIRWYPRLEVMYECMLEHPLKPRDAVIGVLLCQGLAELFHFGTPDHAAVRETAELARTLQRPGSVGLVNALLRRALRERETLEQNLERVPSLRHACPDWLVAGIRSAFPDHWEWVLKESTAQPPMTLRVNTARTSAAEVMAMLARAGLEAVAHPRVSSALTLVQAVEVGQIPGFDTGLVSVQDAAAQLAAPLLAPRPGERILDACAAPGGKTGHLLEKVDGEIDLTALDADGERMGRVYENLRRLGYRARTRIGDLSDPDQWWDGRPYDAILLDAPCSGTGVIRRHPDIKLLRRPGDIPLLARRQRRLLDAAWGLLRPGGRLLYATCSLLREENEGVTLPWLEDTDDAIHEPLDLPMSVARETGHAIPLGADGMDGFHYALFRRRET